MTVFLPAIPSGSFSPRLQNIKTTANSTKELSAMSYEPQAPEESWEGEFDPLADPEESRVLFATLDSFRCV